MPKHRRRPRRVRAQSPGAAVPNTAASTPSDSFAAFRARMHAGDLDGIIGHRLRRTLRNAAADTSLDFEIGALRLALVRLLNEEPDPARQAATAARIAAVAVQAARLRQNPDSGLDAIQAHLIRELAAIEAEHDQARSHQAETKGPASAQPLSDTIDW